MKVFCAVWGSLTPSTLTLQMLGCPFQRPGAVPSIAGDGKPQSCCPVGAGLVLRLHFQQPWQPSVGGEAHGVCGREGWTPCSSGWRCGAQERPAGAARGRGTSAVPRHRRGSGGGSRCRTRPLKINMVSADGRGERIVSLCSVPVRAPPPGVLYPAPGSAAR